MKRAILSVQEVKHDQGSIRSSSMLPIRAAELLDIKPYFPSEDTVKNPVDLSLKQEEAITLRRMGSLQTYELDAMGVIRSVKGNIYIQFHNCIPKNGIYKPGAYLTVFWWFDKFDSKQYRTVTMCNPPYENAPRSGVFATRSPVRPNPIAMTVARVIRVEEESNRIYLNGIESFDKTPCLGISAYHAMEHCVPDAKVPNWLSHWPKTIHETIQNNKNEDLRSTNLTLKSMLSEEETYERESQRKENGRLDLYDKQREIAVYGARENNLKGIDVLIPYGKITAVVGVSGSGKSSLVNQTIYAECKRRMEYLSHSHTIFQSPKVDEIAGCIPAVVITQDAPHGNSFSTVGTYTDAYSYLRNIYANIAIRHCPSCGNEVIPLTKDKILSLLRKQENFKLVTPLKEAVEETSIERAVDVALEMGEGAFYAEFEDGSSVLFQTKQKCYHCDTIMFDMTPATFGYMDADSRCTVCNGTGVITIPDETKVIAHPELSLLEGASPFYGKLRTFWNNPNANWMKGQVFGLAKAMQVDLEKPWRELPIAFRKALLYGSEQEVSFQYDNKKNGRKGEIKRKVEGILPMIERAYEENAETKTLDAYMTKTTCNACQGERLGKEGRMATILETRYPIAASMTFSQMKDFCITLQESLSDQAFSKTEYAIRTLLSLSNTAIELGIGYLKLNQETNTLSGGEGQRLKLLGAFKNHLSGILYIFDEPSRGLHPRDYKKVIDLLKALIKEGNTIIMVEHNEDMIQIADNIIEIGPGAGEEGGRLVGEGTLAAMIEHKGTQISKYWKRMEPEKSKLTSELIKKRRHALEYEMIHLQGLCCHNLKNINISFPKKALTCICGVSGSGKSSLVKGEIYQRAQDGGEFLGVVLVDQLPIGKTSKSIVATYIGVMDFIRACFAKALLSVENGWDERYFSFNSEYGQCDFCKGEGKIKVKYTEGAVMECPDCKGKRYKKKIRAILYKDKSIDQILELSIDEALLFWKEEQAAMDGLRSLQKVGLGYLKLGQGTAALSGGEAARLKLAKELITKKSGNVLYLFDEPTAGLHFSDIEHLLSLIDELILSGNTVITIEHNKQVVKACDWKIELGPGAGEEGGYVVYQGE
ncbi:MAG: excinuclease subunit [Clostridiales bacterium]|nr:excinuclease subunit [Clostridiales bacterium]